MSLDEAVQIALANSDVIREGSGRVLIQPDSVRTSLDPALLATDPNLSHEAALSAFDSQLQASFVYNGGGRTIGSGFSGGNGLFGVYSQPETAATIGIGRKLNSGTKVKVGGVGGYDSALASGFYAAYGAEVRHPLRRGGGYQFNQIAGAHAQPGTYRGELIARIDAGKADLELQHAVTELVREVSQTYWELYYAYKNLDNKFAALDRADDVWRRTQQRVAENVVPADAASLAKQQYFAADAAVKNAIGGTGKHGTGVYAVEMKLRNLLGLPPCDGRLVRPSATPLEAEFCFDWHETISLANRHRVELLKQHSQLHKRELELVAAKNQQRAQVDLVGSYRRLADDPANQSATFSEALDGWQLGVEVSRSLTNRREDVAVENAMLMLTRERRILQEQQNQVSLQLRVAFTELDRAFGVMQSLRASQQAARHRHQAEAARHAAGELSLQQALDAQNKVHQAETAFARSLVDYNLAFIQLHHVRGTLLDMLGVGFTHHSRGYETLYSCQRPTAFAPKVETQMR